RHFEREHLRFPAQPLDTHGLAVVAGALDLTSPTLTGRIPDLDKGLQLDRCHDPDLRRSVVVTVRCRFVPALTDPGAVDEFPVTMKQARQFFGSEHHPELNTSRRLVPDVEPAAAVPTPDHAGIFVVVRLDRLDVVRVRLAG